MKMNYYFYGDKVSRNKLSKIVSRQLFNDLSDEELFYEVPTGPVPFANYKGQPVLIWADRASDLKGQCGGYEGIKAVFDTKYRTGTYNGIPLNVVNIVTGDLLPQLFFNTIAENSADGAHCFPIVAHAKADHYDTMINTEYTKSGRKNHYQKVSTVRFSPN